MNFHSVEIFLRDVNCRKRHHNGSTLLQMRACAIGSQSPTSTTLQRLDDEANFFWLIGISMSQNLPESSYSAIDTAEVPLNLC